MAFVVHGYIAGVAYTLNVSDGGLDGTTGVMDLLEEMRGRVHKATPTGPTAALDLDDPETVLIALMDLTEIVKVDGDVPKLDAPGPTGTVY